MTWIIIIVLVVAIFFAYIRWTNTPRGMAKSTTKTMLASLLAIKNKQNHPIESESDKLKLYAHVLALRPGYTTDDIADLLHQAQALSKVKGETKGTSFNTVVFVVVVKEFSQNGRRKPTEQQLSDIRSTIDLMLS